MQFGVDVRVKFGDSRSNGSRVVRAAHFVMDDDERTTTDGGRDNRRRRKSDLAFRLKITTQSTQLQITICHTLYRSYCVTMWLLRQRATCMSLSLDNQYHRNDNALDAISH